MQQIAQMKLQNLLPTSKNPGALTNGVLGAILGKNQPSDQNTGTSTDAVSGILGALGGGKQQKRPASSQQSTAPPADADQQQQQSNPLGDVLNQVLNKKQKQQQPAPSEPPKR
jgi:hypothetical protein